MPSADEKVDMEAMNAAIDKVLAFTPPPKAEQDKKRAQRKDKQTPLVQESKAPYKADER